MPTKKNIITEHPHCYPLPILFCDFYLPRVTVIQVTVSTDWNTKPKRGFSTSSFYWKFHDLRVMSPGHKHKRKSRFRFVERGFLLCCWKRWISSFALYVKGHTIPRPAFEFHYIRYFASHGQHVMDILRKPEQPLFILLSDCNEH